MTLQQTLQSNTSRTRELFGKLEETSDQAVKTRENLFEELSRELRLHAELEQKHLLPALRSHDKTRSLAPEAAKLNQELRAKVDEIEGLAKSDPSFRPRLAELRKLFNRQLRDERAELLPAIEKELTDEQAEALVKKIEAKRALAEEEQRLVATGKKAVGDAVDATKQNARDLGKSASDTVDAAKDKGRDLAKSAGDAASATKDKTRELAKAAADTARDGADKLRDTAEAARDKTHDLAKSAVDAAREGADKVRETSEKAADRVTNAVRRAKGEVDKTVTVYRKSARERGADVRAVGNALRNFGRVGSELRSVLVASVKQSGRDGLAMTKQLVRHPSRFGQLQRQYAAASTRNLMESTKEILQILRAASGAAQPPLEQRLKATSS